MDRGRQCRPHPELRRESDLLKECATSELRVPRAKPNGFPSRAIDAPLILTRRNLIESSTQICYKRTVKAPVLIFVIVASFAAAAPPVPQMISYQGRLSVDGA